ncbi:FIG049111: Hypothetical protein in pyoverdin gene cluster [plant metagenome]|uniref:Uncharacterized protein n=1 Tax=plant metagenome TaxID=1297885 RepID=A0A484RF46_9ZZZZ
MPSTQVIRPAGAGHETLAVLGACALIVALAASYIGLRPAAVETQAVSANQIDARRALTPAEQGIYADLRVASEEISFAAQAEGALPGVAGLAELGLPPFVVDNSTAVRGGHAWTAQPQAAQTLYVGRSADNEVAGSFILRVPSAANAAPAADGHDHGHAGASHGLPDGEPDVWLSREASASLPDPANDAALAAAGWRQVVAQFDSGVTRQSRP